MLWHSVFSCKQCNHQKTTITDYQHCETSEHDSHNEACPDCRKFTEWTITSTPVGCLLVSEDVYLSRHR